MQSTDPSHRAHPELTLPKSRENAPIPLPRSTILLVILIVAPVSVWISSMSMDLTLYIRKVFGPPRFTSGSYAVIYDGMSREEVEALLGPPGNSTTWPGKSESLTDLAEMWRPQAFHTNESSGGSATSAFCTCPSMLPET
jgi:hypothetical protein